MQLITAPSKTQKTDGRNFSEFSQPLLQEKSQILIDQLQTYSKEELSRLMKTSEKLTQATYARIHSFKRPFTLENSRQALFTFQGDTFSTMDADHYSNKEIHHAQKHLSILSGLYGLLRPLDLMQPYRLEMGAAMAVKGCKNLYQFWTDSVTEVLSRTLAENTDQTLVNLASTEYSKVVNRKNFEAKMITITFRQKHKGGYKTIPIHSKRARGLMVHFMISNQIDSATDLQQFNLDGYSFNREISTDDNWYFLQN